MQCALADHRHRNIAVLFEWAFPLVPYKLVHFRHYYVSSCEHRLSIVTLYRNMYSVCLKIGVFDDSHLDQSQLNSTFVYLQ